jgi:hypothetical protein
VDTNQINVLVVIEVHHGVDNHRGKELAVASDQLGVHRSSSTLLQQAALFSASLHCNRTPGRTSRQIIKSNPTHHHHHHHHHHW